MISNSNNNTKNVIVSGFTSKSLIHAINLLKENNIIDVKAWIGTKPECTYNFVDFIIGDVKKDRFHGTCSDIYSDVFHSSIHRFMDMMSRHSFYAEKTFHDKLNLFNIFFDEFSNLIVRDKINLILFSNIPHEGPDLVLYEIAKNLNIQTILLYQSIFPNKFFYLYDMNDFGLFNVKAFNELAHIKIQKEHKKEHFYMSNLKIYKYGLFSLQRKSFTNFIMILYYGMKSILQKYFKIELNKNKTGTTEQYTNPNSAKAHISGFFSRLSFFLRSFERFYRKKKYFSVWNFFQRYSNYKKSRHNFLMTLDTQIDLDKNFVYFPLHLQPELSTSAIGEIYSDQILAIERLSKFIPDDWFIYVKENPKQTEKMRGEWFFSRLRLIKNVKYVSPDFNTYSMIEKCNFVATITGSAGWEAISGGKCTLVFGNPWYKSLPGVFSYNEKLTLGEIMNYNVDHQELEKNLNLLLCKTGNGVIDETYAQFVENFNIPKNAINIASFLKRVIEST